MDNPTRLAVLWSEIPAYLAACLRELVQRYEVELLVVRRKVNSEHEFSDELFAWIDRLVTLPDAFWSTRWMSLRSLFSEFKPDVVLSSGWLIPEYWLAAVWSKSQRAATICCMDTHWRGSLKQRFSLPLSRLLLSLAFDYMWVPGERQAAYARKLGFAADRTLRGFYSCDTPTFAAAAEDRRRILERGPYPERFLYVGAFAPWKGICELLQAYRLYRQRVSNPWPLVCIGDGPQTHLLKGQPGVVAHGFMQPSQVAQAFAQAGVFVLPSLSDAHGVVVHEAATVGLPILCSNAAGAAADFVRDAYNGYLFDPSDIKCLAKLMEHITSGQVDLKQMGERSRQLAAQLTTDRWADYLVEALRLRAGLSVRRRASSKRL